MPKIIAEKQDFHKPVHPFCRCGTACGKPSLVSVTKKKIYQGISISHPVSQNQPIFIRMLIGFRLVAAISGKVFPLQILPPYRALLWDPLQYILKV